MMRTLCRFKFLSLLLIAGALLVMSVGTQPLPAAADDDFIVADVKGEHDPANVKRVDGSVLLDSDHRAFDEYTAALGRVEFDYGTQSFKPWQKLKLEGAHSYAFYRMPKDVTTLEPLRSYQEELTAQGYEVLFQGSGEELDDGYGRFVSQVYGKKVAGSLMEYVLPAADDFRYIVLRKNREDGGQSVFTGFFAKVSPSWGSKYGKPDDVIGRIDILETKALATRLVLVKAEDMAQQIDARGSVALYGILFDFNKTDIKPESHETLAEVAKYLNSDPAVKLVVTGHTDNAGNFEFNRDLSERRARAVVDYLVSAHKIARERLFSFGASFAAPVSSNATEEGRAKNRRVELVKF